MDSALVEACHRGDIHVVAALLQCGANIAAGNDAPFRAACAGGHLDLVRMLLAVPPGAQRPPSAFWRSLADGVIVDRPVACGVHIHAANDEAFRAAAKGGHLDVVRLLLAATDPGAIDVRMWDDAVLRTVARGGHIAVARYLMSVCNVPPTSAAFQEAASAKQTNMLSLFLRHGFTGAADWEGAAFWEAARRKNVGVLRVLVRIQPQWNWTYAAPWVCAALKTSKWARRHVGFASH